jgi:hypothetical protein
MRRRLPGILIVIASIVLVLATLSVWVARQVMNTDDWVKTSSALIRNPDIQQATAAYVGDQIPQQAITTKLEQILPPRLAPLASTAAGGVAELAQRATLRALESGAFQKLWDSAQRASHKQFINAVENGSGNTVVFDLRPMIGRVAQRVGISSDVVNSLPPDRGKIVILKSDELATVRSLAKALRGLAIVLVLLWVVLTAVGVYLAGDRRKTLLHAGLGIFIGALFVLALRRVLGHVVVTNLSNGGASEPAAAATFNIGTSLLRQIAGTVLVLGLLMMLSAALAGPARWAARVRQWIGPTMRDQPGIAYAVAIGVLVILLAVGLLPGSTRIIPVVIYAVLIVVGVGALRRQAVNEITP